MDLTERTAWGWLEQSLGEAEGYARQAVTNLYAWPGFVRSMQNAENAMRGIALLRSDAQWLRLAQGAAAMHEGIRGVMPATGDLRWHEVADRLARMRPTLARMFVQSMADRRAEGSVVNLAEWGTDLTGRGH